MTSVIKRIAISTGGGDAPGLNAVIQAATLAARNRGWEVVGIRDGFNGLMLPDDYPDGGLIDLTRERVRGLIPLGGTTVFIRRDLLLEFGDLRAELVEVGDRLDRLQGVFEFNDPRAQVFVSHNPRS